MTVENTLRGLNDTNGGRTNESVFPLPARLDEEANGAGLGVGASGGVDLEESVVEQRIELEGNLRGEIRGNESKGIHTASPTAGLTSLI